MSLFTSLSLPCKTPLPASAFPPRPSRLGLPASVKPSEPLP